MSDKACNFEQGNSIIVEPGNRYMLIGDDMRMNGLDAPARVMNVSGALWLIAQLRAYFRLDAEALSPED